MSKLHLISSKLGEQVIQMPPLLREKSYQISGDPSGKGERHKKPGFICSFCCTHLFYFAFCFNFLRTASYLNLTQDLKCKVV